MKLPYLLSADISKLREGCKSTLAHYKSPALLSEHLDNHSISSRESLYILSDAPKLDGKLSSDSNNAKLLHTWIHSAQPFIPRSVLGDGRLWAALCHTVYRDYMIERWVNADLDPEEEISDGNNPKGYGTITSRFFVSGEGQRGIVRNGLARLYWAAELSIVNNDYKLLDTMFYKQDIHASIIERSMSLDTELTKGILTRFENIKNTEYPKLKKKIQLATKLINGAGGTRTLETVKNNDLDSCFKQSFDTTANS